MKRVVVSGMGGLTPIGCDWHEVVANLRARRSGIRTIPDWNDYEGLGAKLGAPIERFDRPEHYARKAIRSMGRVSLLATRATELALDDAKLLGDPLLASGDIGIAYGSSSGSPPAIADFGQMMLNHSTEGLSATSYIKMMPHTTAVNLCVFYGVRGRVITTSSACTSGSQGIGYAYESIRYGKQVAMIAGGAEELSPTQVAVFDTLYATSTRNAEPQSTPRPFDAARDGLVVGEGAATLILEEYEHARARGAPIYAEVVGFGTNADGAHVTQPERETMQACMRLALADAGLDPSAVGYVSAHGTATDRGDVAESEATSGLFGSKMPISALKSYTGHTLGACGAIEAWVAVEMQRDGWYHPTLNLETVDPRCAPLDYIVGEGRALDCEYVMSNNFAFGGINTSLIFRRLS
ncbi:MAG TPA: beta-ketoacyl-ACP synthase [Pseudomonadales bacterium]|nr:beta-ketoacyl-ACP synthase [Pseudomonadales bacterium]